METPAENETSSSPSPVQVSLSPTQVSHSPDQVTLTAAESFMHRQVQVAEAKDQIAALSTAVISAPEDNVMIFTMFLYI